MSKGAWNVIKNTKSFYVTTFRRAVAALAFSLGLNCVLSLGIFYTYSNLPEPDFYATNGIVPPVQLTPMLEPNNSSVALLPPDPINTEEIKVIPQ